MARIRTIKPEFADSESMARVSREARLLFVLLWTIADDEGRMRGSPRFLASKLYPYDDDVPGLIGAWLGELEGEGCVLQYDTGTDHYLSLPHWPDHQKIDKPSPSRIPPPPSLVVAKPRERSRIVGEGSRPSRARADLDQDQGKDQGTTAAPASGADVPTNGTGRKVRPLWDWFCATWGLPGDGGRQKGLAGEFDRNATAAGVTVAECERFRAEKIQAGKWEDFVQPHSTWTKLKAWRDATAPAPRRVRDIYGGT